MQFDEPAKVYTAASNLEAHIIEGLLVSNDIPAFAMEDQSPAGVWMGGALPMIHRPTIWVDRKNADAAGNLIAAYEEQQQARRTAEHDGSPITVVCEECEASSTFPASLRGTIQECSACHAYVDVGETDWPVDVGEPEDEQNPS